MVALLLSIKTLLLDRIVKLQLHSSLYSTANTIIVLSETCLKKFVSQLAEIVLLYISNRCKK